MPRYYIPGRDPSGSADAIWGWADNIETVRAWAALQDKDPKMVFLSYYQSSNEDDTFDFRADQLLPKEVNNDNR